MQTQTQEDQTHNPLK